jgi:serine/threonine-protein kinase
MPPEDAAKREMTPERGQQLKNLLAAAIRLPAGERPAFLDHACRGDMNLRRELESLIAAHESAEGGRLESPARSLSGQTIGRYHILQKIGEGGMGVVYRASDPKLGRDVAIKILPDIFTSDPERLARFEREARMLAALNHPHIASIYGVEESGGNNALVLELVEGETLADRLRRGPVAIPEAIDIARQIAEALEYGHDHGIIHRDLKPANVKLTPDGVVKVLDYGLAKVAVNDASGADSSSLPTISMRQTRAGALVGTPAYMSPEQARGKPVDKRADIWAFGCVLYEMVAGCRPFPGETNSDLIAAILEREPDWEKLPRATPEPLRRLLTCCLEKDPKRRLRDVGDARLDLEQALSAPPSIEPPQRLTRRTAIAILGGAAAGTLATGIFSVTRWRGAIPRSLTRFAIAFPEARYISATWGDCLSIAPDGSRIAFLAKTAEGAPYNICLHWLGDLESKIIKDVTAGASFFSPDSNWLGYIQATPPPPSMRKMPLRGGAPVTIFTRKAAAGNAGASWAGDGTIYFVTEVPGGLRSVPAAGGQPKEVMPIDAAHGERIIKWPSALPGAKAVLYTFATESSESFDEAHIAVYLPHTGQKKVLIEGGTHPRYSPSGHLVYARGGKLLAVRFDAERLQVSGQPVQVVEGVLMSRNTGGAYFDISTNGDLVYTPGICEGGARTLYWVDRSGNSEKLPLPARSYLHPRISPDGRKLAIEIEGSNHDCYIYDFTSGVLSNITDNGISHWPLWSPDGKTIGYRSGPMMGMRIWQVPADRSRPPEQVPADGYTQNAESYSPDGRAIAYTATDPGVPTRVVVVPLQGDRKPRALDDSKYAEGSPKFSPDGRWLAYCSNESGTPQVYVQAFPGPGAKTQVSNDGGTDPVWKRSGGELFYRNGDSMMAVHVSTASGFTAGRPQELWKAHYSHGMSASCGPAGLTSSNYDVTPDGRRFLMIKDDDQDSAISRQIIVALGWSDELNRLVKS